MRVVREVRTLYSLKKITQTPARAIVGTPSPHQTRPRKTTIAVTHCLQNYSEKLFPVVILHRIRNIFQSRFADFDSQAIDCSHAMSKVATIALAWTQSC